LNHLGIHLLTMAGRSTIPKDMDLANLLVWFGAINDKQNWALDFVISEMLIQIFQHLNIQVLVDISLRTDRKIPCTCNIRINQK
jgi:hypothetical protein